MRVKLRHPNVVIVSLRRSAREQTGNNNAECSLKRLTVFTRIIRKLFPGGVGQPVITGSSRAHRIRELLHLSLWYDSLRDARSDGHRNASRQKLMNNPD